MKNLLYSIALLCGTATIAQTNNGHEARIGTAFFGFPSVELSYEYLYRDNFTFGATAVTTLDMGSKREGVFAFTPFTRLYFNSNWDDSAGAYLEGFGQFLTGYHNRLEADSIVKNRYTGAAAGIAIGEKFLWGPVVFDANIGAGKIFGDANAPDGVFKLSLSIGYRFE